MKVIFIHGIFKQLSKPKLLFQFNTALFEEDVPGNEICYYDDILHPPAQSLEKLWRDKIEDVEKDILKVCLNDVYAYLLDKSKQAAIEKRLTDILDSSREPVIIVAHSLGSVIAFKVLTQYAGRVEVPLLLTLGSPLGINALERELMKQLGTTKMSKPPGVVKWLNIASILDPVAADATLADEYLGRCIKDKLILNKDTLSLRTAHSVVGYLESKEARGAVLSAILLNSTSLGKYIYNLGT